MYAPIGQRFLKASNLHGWNLGPGRGPKLEVDFEWIYQVVHYSIAYSSCALHNRLLNSAVIVLLKVTQGNIHKEGRYE